MPNDAALYVKAIDVLSELDFETDDLSEGDLGEEIKVTIKVVAKIFEKPENEVRKDLLELRNQRDEEGSDLDEQKFGHLNAYGETPSEANAE